MNWIFIVFSIVSGAVISFFYFGGLWLTLQKIEEHNLSYWLVLVSFIGRLAFVLAVFYSLIIYHWAYMAIALISFLATRHMILAWLGKPEKALSN